MSCTEITFYKHPKIVDALPILNERFNIKSDAKVTEAAKAALDQLTPLIEAANLNKNNVFGACLGISGVSIIGFGAAMMSTHCALVWLAGLVPSLVCGQVAVFGREENSYTNVHTWIEKVHAFNKQLEYFNDKPEDIKLSCMFIAYENVKSASLSEDRHKMPSYIQLMKMLIACFKAKNKQTDMTEKWDKLLKAVGTNDFTTLNQEFWYSLGLAAPDSQEFLNFSKEEEEAPHIPNVLANLLINSVKNQCKDSLLFKFNPAFYEKEMNPLNYERL